MSVQQEQLRMGRSSGESAAEESAASDERITESQTEQPPELEFSMPESEESLTAYLSAIGGAVIGLLLTLLVLAIWNGGTLNFTNSSRVDALEAGLTRVDENLGAVNTNVETLGERLAALEGEAGVIAELQNSLTTLDSSLATLDTTLGEQGIRVDELDAAVQDLNVTRQNFDTFTAALAQALEEMGAVTVPAEGESAAPAESTAAPSEGEAAPAEEGAAEETSAAAASEEMPAAEAGMPVMANVATHEDVAADAVLAYLFVDANGDGMLDEGETVVSDGAFTLTDSEGETISSATKKDGGVLFSGLAAGAYSVTVTDAEGAELALDSEVIVTVDAEAEAGQVVYFALPAGE